MERISKVILALLFLPFALQAQWQIGQRAFTRPSGGGGVTWSRLQTITGSCTTTTCTLSATTTANSVIVVIAYESNGNAFSSCTGGGGTWVTGSSANYLLYNSAVTGMAGAYNISGTGGSSTITCTFATAVGSASVYLNEFARSTGTATLDALASTTVNSTSCSNPWTAAAFTSLSGTSDLIVQNINYQSGSGTIASPYVYDPNGNAAYALNTTQTTAPNVSGTTGGCQAMAWAFK